MSAHYRDTGGASISRNHDKQFYGARNADVVPLKHDGNSRYDSARHRLRTEMHWLLVAPEQIRTEQKHDKSCRTRRQQRSSNTDSDSEKMREVPVFLLLLLKSGDYTKGKRSHSEFRKLNKSFRSLGVSRLNLPVTP